MRKDKLVSVIKEHFQQMNNNMRGNVVFQKLLGNMDKNKQK